MAEQADKLIRTRCVITSPFTQFPMVQMIACAECGAFLWDVEQHFAATHKEADDVTT